MKKYCFIFFVIFFFLSFGAYCQDDPCPGGIPQVCFDNGDCSNCLSALCTQCIEENRDASVPIDGGLSWLLLAGIGLAGNHIRKKRKGKRINE